MPDHKIIQIWEHQFDSLVNNDEKFKDFIKVNKTSEPIKLRDALFGGNFF
jgi:hypothetical protein